MLQKANPSVISYLTQCCKSSPTTNYTRSLPIKSEQLARLCAEFAANKKAEDIIALDLRGISSFTDFFILCSGTSDPHIKAIAGEIQDQLKTEHKMKPHGVDGYPMSQWIIVDYSDVIVHVFHEQKRKFYSLEDLWSDAPRLKLPEN